MLYSPLEHEDEFLDYDYPTPDDFGYVAKEDLPNFDDVRDFLEGIKESLYETGNVDELENCLEELCEMFDVSFEAREQKIEKKNKNRLMHWYLGYQRAAIEQGRKNHE